MFERQVLLYFAQILKSLYNYQNLLNNVKITADVMYDVSKELLSHSDTPTVINGPQKAQDREPFSCKDAYRLKVMTKARRRKWIQCFNGRDGAKLRFEVPGHTPRHGQVLYCVMCGQNEGPWRVHRSFY